MRKIQATKLKGQPIAKFHQWSVISEEVEGGALHEPVAIVELSDGSVDYWGIACCQLKFLPEETTND